jgi:hypothetical protein
MPLTVHQFPCLSDNYGFLIRDEASGLTACIDTPEAGAILRELDDLGWDLDFIPTTPAATPTSRPSPAARSSGPRRSPGSRPSTARWSTATSSIWARPASR